MKIFICSSSRDRVNQEYLNLADDVAEEISALGHNLIFGAASTGMMGKCMRHFNKIYSYTVEKYVDDLKNIPSYKEYILKTTFDRSKKMFIDCDLILALPGGTGTIAEIYSILEENRSILKRKPFIIYNYNGYYDNLLQLIDTCISNNFNDKSIKDYYEVCNSLEEVIAKIKSTKIN